jgi:hypothetical protein
MSARITLIAMLAIVLPTAAALAQLNNGDFTHELDGWQVSAAQTHAVLLDDTQFYSEPLALRMRHQNAATSRATQSVSLKANQTYTLLARVRAANIAGGNAMVTVHAGGATLAASRPLIGTSGTGGWQQVALVFDSGTNTTATVQLALTDASGDAWFDDVELREGRHQAQQNDDSGADLENIALGKPYTLTPNPNYGYCTDPGDATQLTDGVYTDGYFWVQPSTVGWTGAHPATVTIDLGEVHPIRGASYNTAGGRADVAFPPLIFMLVSEDNQTWHYAGNIVELSAEHGLPDPATYAIHRYWTDRLATRGRYVKFMAPSGGGGYSFVDEIEVYRGDDAQSDRPAPGPDFDIDDAEEFFAAQRVTAMARQRMTADLLAICDTLGETHADLASRIETVQVDVPTNFRAILPLGDLHRRIFQLQAKGWRKFGFDGLVVWRTNPWDMISHLEPPRQGGATLDVHLARNERQADAFLLSNAGNTDADVRLVVRGLPDGCVTIREAPFTDTASGIPVLAALPEAQRDGDACVITVHSGTTKQVWLTFDGKGLEAGEHDGAIALSSHNQSIPVTLTVYPVDFPDKPRLHLGGWDYTNAVMRDVTDANRDALIAHLRDRYVDTPWATGGVLNRSLNTSQLDTWLERWPNATNYFVFVAVTPTSFGHEMGSDAFNETVTEWIDFYVDALRERGVEPHQLGLLLVDENHSIDQDETIIAYAKVIQAAQPDVVIWGDPTWRDPREALPEMFEVHDVLCPNMPMWISNSEIFKPFFTAQRDAGRELWFYSCSGPGKLLDPYSYHRMQPWFCFQYDAKGMGYWAFGDSSNASTWNEYMAATAAYTPIFIDDTTVTAGKHMEAIREGVEDYEILCLLQDRVNDLSSRGVRNDTIDEAQRFLATAAQRVTHIMKDSSEIKWDVPKDRSVMDAVRIEALKLLSQLSVH